MNDAQSINAWMKEWGYKWVEGEERIYKSQLSWLEATQLIESLEGEGAVRRG